MLSRKLLAAVMSLLGVVPSAGSISSVQGTDWLGKFNDSAGRTSDDSQVSAYSRILVETFTSNILSGRFQRSLVNRLMAGDMAAREGGRLITEEQISEAYNRLVQSMKLPARLESNAGWVHLIRQTLRSRVPNIIPSTYDQSLCLPDEALFLVIVLMQGTGPLSEDQSTAPLNHSLPRMYVDRSGFRSVSQTLLLDETRDKKDTQIILERVFSDLGL